mgnify:CR=1 FL=1
MRDNTTIALLSEGNLALASFSGADMVSFLNCVLVTLIVVALIAYVEGK